MILLYINVEDSCMVHTRIPIYSQVCTIKPPASRFQKLNRSGTAYYVILHCGSRCPWLLEGAETDVIESVIDEIAAVVDELTADAPDGLLKVAVIRLDGRALHQPITEKLPTSSWREKGSTG